MFASLIIRARNEAQALTRLLPLLAAQDFDRPFEIILLDNESHDDTATIAAQHGIIYYQIPRDSFTYAGALNTGAQLARGEIVVHLSAHCFPRSSHWLARLIAPLQSYSTIGATYGRQIVDAHITPLLARDYAGIFPAAGEPPMVAFSNANCAVRRSIVLRHPFNPSIPILEDHLFFLELHDDWRFVYVPEAAVDHEHDRSAWRSQLRRWYFEGQAHYFLNTYRRLDSPMVPQPFDTARNSGWHIRLAGAAMKRGDYTTALLTLPYFWTRSFTTMLGRWKAYRRRALIASDDAIHRAQTTMNGSTLAE